MCAEDDPVGGHSGDGGERFRTEGIARLQHPGIVQVFEVGEHDGRPFMALEFCAGGSLDAKLAKNPLPPTRGGDAGAVAGRGGAGGPRGAGASTAT